MLTNNQKMNILGFSIMFTLFSIGVLLNALIEMIFILTVMSVINFFLALKGDYRTHALRVKFFNKFFMCYVVSTSLVLSVVLAMRFAQENTTLLETFLFGFILIGFCTLFMSKLFYADDSEEDEPTRREIKKFLQTLTRKDALQFLGDRLPPRQAQAIYHTDWEGQDREYVGSFFLNGVSASAVRDLKKQGYDKLVEERKRMKRTMD
jgi:hypothetical protein